MSSKLYQLIDNSKEVIRLTCCSRDPAAAAQTVLLTLLGFHLSSRVRMERIVGIKHFAITVECNENKTIPSSSLSAKVK